MKFRIFIPCYLFIILTVLTATSSAFANPYAFKVHDKEKGEAGESSLNQMDIENNLKNTVKILSEEIGSRSYMEIDALNKTAEYITEELGAYGYTVSSQIYEAGGETYRNIFTEIKGKKIPEKILIIGAHYDTVTGTPGADDNASGVAGLLELARLLQKSSFNKTVQFVAFTLEEPPFFRTKNMGSYKYAEKLHKEDAEIEGMVCLESIGYFINNKGGQNYPLPFFRWFYPEKGNFISLVSDLQSKDFLTRVKGAFKKNSVLPVESISAFSIIPGIDFSDHRSFWKFGYKALMVTDTAFYRNANYHGMGDTPDTLDFKSMADVVLGLKAAMEELAQ